MKKFILCFLISCLCALPIFPEKGEWVAWVKQFDHKKMVVHFPRSPFVQKVKEAAVMSVKEQDVTYTLKIYDRNYASIEEVLSKYCFSSSQRNLLYSDQYKTAQGDNIDMIYTNNKKHLWKEKMVITKDQLLHFITDFPEGVEDHHNRFCYSLDFLLEAR